MGLAVIAAAATVAVTAIPGSPVPVTTVPGTPVPVASVAVAATAVIAAACFRTVLCAFPRSPSLGCSACVA